MKLLGKKERKKDTRKKGLKKERKNEPKNPLNLFYVLSIVY